MKVIIFLCFFFVMGFTMAGNDPVKTISGKQYKVNLKTGSWQKEMNEGGFFIHLGLFIPSKDCYIPLGANNETDEHFKLGPHLELGNMFRIAELNDNAVGLRATWLSASYSSWSVYDADLSYIQGSVLRVGPYFTYTISDEMAIDGFYQIGPTYTLDPNADTTVLGHDNSGYLGVTHNIGAAFRYKMYSLGFDLGFGSVKYLDKDEYDGLSDDMVHDFYKIRTSYFRIFAGFRF